jgi:hypothetical protein
MHATFWKPASSNLFAAAVDLHKEGKNHSHVMQVHRDYIPLLQMQPI